MLVFATKIPVQPDMTEQEFIQLCSEWIYESPYYHQMVIQYDISAHSDYDIQVENILCQIRCYKDDKAEIVAFRLKNINNNGVWRLDLIFICENNRKFIIVQNDLDSNTYSPGLPRACKPSFIKKLMEKDYGLKEKYFEVKDSVMICDSETVEAYAEFINGNIDKELPMVYISKDFDIYNVNYQNLSRWLSGMAYVVLESDKDTSFRLRELTDSRNAHNGYIGIYYPGVNNYHLYSPVDFEAGKFEENIILLVQQSLINRMSSDEYNWYHVQMLKTRSKFTYSQKVIQNELKEKNESLEDFRSYAESLEKELKEKEQSLEDFIRYADGNERELKERIKTLQENNDFLTYQLESKKISKNSGSICLKTDLQDFYTDEQHDFILNVLNEVKNKIGVLDVKRFRRHEILNSILENNNQTSQGKKISEELKRIFKPGLKWNGNTKSKIKELGFTIDENGHNKIIFHDNKYMYTVSSTPSDGRGISNLLSEIENGISITKKLL